MIESWHSVTSFYQQITNVLLFILTQILVNIIFMHLTNIVCYIVGSNEPEHVSRGFLKLSGTPLEYVVK